MLLAVPMLLMALIIELPRMLLLTALGTVLMVVAFATGLLKGFIAAPLPSFNTP